METKAFRLSVTCWMKLFYSIVVALHRMREKSLVLHEIARKRVKKIAAAGQGNTSIDAYIL